MKNVFCSDSLNKGKEFTKSYEIHYYDVSTDQKCKLTSIINFICDIGTQHSEKLDVGLSYLNENKYGWVFYKYDINVYRYPLFGETISITTRVTGIRTFYAPREYIIKDEKGNVIADGKALFFLINTEKRRPSRVPCEIFKAYGIEKNLECKIDTEKLHKPDTIDYQKDFYIRHSDIDTNKHVNNEKYVEWALEAVPSDILDNYEIHNIKVLFEKETKYGDKITATAKIDKTNKETLKSHHTIISSASKELTILEIEWKRK
ncbi:acyl-ACP thioesterase domain-containing protein [Clostridium sp. BJN0001]|uniref:acyl-[acyl-carrier-protein] thioesterase n=1 Tax=Clostridium sp. BJN0001 TaxID=2930219 RepID=UPI001FD44DA4|nr:acyl-ACP thioesterase domain-containing protein [Clostridium sp. BJN0001]